MHNPVSTQGCNDQPAAHRGTPSSLWQGSELPSVVRGCRGPFFPLFHLPFHNSPSSCEALGPEALGVAGGWGVQPLTYLTAHKPPPVVEPTWGQTRPGAGPQEAGTPSRLRPAWDSACLPQPSSQPPHLSEAGKQGCPLMAALTMLLRCCSWPPALAEEQWAPQQPEGQEA